MDSSRRKTIHGNLVEVYGVGVLLLGDAGTGKTTCSIELLERGHRLIADDAVELTVWNNQLVGSGPIRFRRMANIRPFGLTDLTACFDSAVFCDEASISLVIRLFEEGEGRSNDDIIELLGMMLPALDVKLRPNIKISTMVENAVRRRFG